MLWFKVTQPGHQVETGLGLGGGDPLLFPVSARERPFPRSTGWRSPSCSHRQPGALETRAPPPGLSPHKMQTDQKLGPRGHKEHKSLQVWLIKEQPQELPLGSLPPPAGLMGAGPAQRLLVQSFPPGSVGLTQVSAQSSQKQRQQERPHRGVSTGTGQPPAPGAFIWLASRRGSNLVI